MTLCEINMIASKVEEKLNLKGLLQVLQQELQQQIVYSQDVLMNLEEVAEWLHKSPDAVKHMCYRGQIPNHKNGSEFWFIRREITEYIASLPSSLDNKKST